jgi:hypothetical protein
MKQQQVQQNQAQQSQQIQTQQGGSTIYFVTFPSKVSSPQAKEIIKELRKRYPGQAIFTPRIPPGRKMTIEIGGTLVIVTFPYIKKNPNKQGEGEGFSLRDLIKNKTI